MKRKLIRQGGGGYTVYLPKKWVDSRGLHAGDEIDFKETSRGLFIQTDTRPEKKEATLDAEFRNKRFLEYALTDYYRAGFDIINLPASIKEKDLQRPLSFLGGFEISSVRKDCVTVEIMAEPFEDKTDMIMKHVLFILKDDLKHVTDAFKDVKKIDSDKIASDGTRMVKQINMFMRTVSRRVSDLNPFHWSLINLLHFIGRRIEYLSIELKGMKPSKLRPELIEYIEAVSRSIDLLYDGIYKRSFNSLEKMHNEHTHYSKKIGHSYESLNSYELTIFFHFNAMYRFILYTTGAAIGIIALEDRSD